MKYTIAEALHEIWRLRGADAGRLRGVEVRYHLDELTDLDRLTAPTRHQGTTWCVHCGIWLVHDEMTGAWISFAEHVHRRPVYQCRQAIATAREAALAAQPAVESLLPAGWHSRIGDASHGGCYTLDLHPPTGPVDLYAYLVAPTGDDGWRVRLYHRGIGVCRTLFIPVTATPATFPEAADAMPQAVAAVTEARTAARVGSHGGGTS